MKNRLLIRRHVSGCFIRPNNPARFSLSFGIYRVGRGPIVEVTACFWRWYLRLAVHGGDY
jgi:hypothetical protein